MEDGQTVVATARGIFTSAGGVLESKETGEKEMRFDSTLTGTQKDPDETIGDRTYTRNTRLAGSFLRHKE